MLTFLTYFVLVINGNRINRFHLFWDTLYIGLENNLEIARTISRDIEKKAPLINYVMDHQNKSSRRNKIH